jgi:hypothetical protein
VTIHHWESVAFYDFLMASRAAVGARKLTNHYTGEHVRPAVAVMSDRQCTRTGCSERAEVTLTYDYGQSHAWLEALSAERDPHTYDMCTRHAERLSVPSGWHLDDRRPSRHLNLIAS